MIKSLMNKNFVRSHRRAELFRRNFVVLRAGKTTRRRVTTVSFPELKYEKSRRFVTVHWTVKCY